MKEKIADVIVVGAGASGMMAAITAARTGCRVLMLEHKEEPGKKILATGNGRCNFTNTVQGSECYRGSAPAFVLQCLEQFGAQDAIDFFKTLGIWTKEKNGYCYPRSMQAGTIREGLLQELKRLRVCVRCDVGIRKITKEKNVFCIQTKEGDLYAKTCILATGGSASPQSGSDGSGYIYAQQMGHSCIEPVPALVPLYTKETWLKQVKGVRAEGTVKLFVENRKVAFAEGELQLTDYGISGIPTFQVSRYAAHALKEKKTVTAVLDFLPEIDTDELVQWLSGQFRTAKKTPEQILGGLLNRKLAQALVLLGSSCKKSQNTPLQQAQVFSRFIKNCELHIVGTGTFKQAQVTAGGVDMREIHGISMESNLVKGLYFAGEMLDVDGICGGYNLQWAWTSGYLAGLHAAHRVKG